MQSIRGFNDYYGIQAETMWSIFNTAKNVASRTNFQYLITPTLEKLALFERNLGEDTDVVAKEIYKFQDRNEEFIALRPEMTAGVVRAVSENHALKSAKMPLKLFSFGQVFRHERPQAGRYREFYQVNFEIFGANHFIYDVQIIQTANLLLQELQIRDYTLEINFIGGHTTKDAYSNYLIEYFTKYKNDISESSVMRLNAKKPLRILDSKDSRDQEISSEALPISKFYTPEVLQNKNIITSCLDKNNIQYTINPRLVRGLDYYTGIIFEYVNTELESKSQKTILGGGRYDNMASQISNGKIDTPCIGFGAGVERLALVQNSIYTPSRKLAITYVENENVDIVTLCYNMLISNHILTEYTFDIICGYSSLSKRISRANEMGFDGIIIIGEEEYKNRKAKIKWLSNNTNTLLEEIVF